MEQSVEIMGNWKCLQRVAPLTKNMFNKLLLVISNSTLLNELHDGDVITISKN